MYAYDMERVRLSFELDGQYYHGFLRPYWNPPGYVFSVVLNTQWMGNLTHTSAGWRMEPVAPQVMIDYLSNYVMKVFEWKYPVLY
jgi:hypothetical protein